MLCNICLFSNLIKTVILGASSLSLYWKSSSMFIWFSNLTRCTFMSRFANWSFFQVTPQNLILYHFCLPSGVLLSTSNQLICFIKLFSFLSTWSNWHNLVLITSLVHSIPSLLLNSTLVGSYSHNSTLHLPYHSIFGMLQYTSVTPKKIKQQQ